MYCVKCGVELADSQRVCPLCGTRVFHPDIPRTPADPPYPPDERVHPDNNFPSESARYKLLYDLAEPLTRSWPS